MVVEIALKWMFNTIVQAPRKDGREQKGMCLWTESYNHRIGCHCSPCAANEEDGKEEI
jgi:hypothetical protein